MKKTKEKPKTHPHSPRVGHPQPCQGLWELMLSRNEEAEGETQDPPSYPEGGAPDLVLLVCARATRRRG
jgi:hypothetical protein